MKRSARKSNSNAALTLLVAAWTGEVPSIEERTTTDAIGSMAIASRTTSSREMGVDFEVVPMAEVELLAQPIIIATLVGSMICTKIINLALLKIIEGRMKLADGAATARMAVADEGATVDSKMAI